jgi:hypothetical protein
MSPTGGDKVKKKKEELISAQDEHGPVHSKARKETYRAQLM